LTAAHLHFRVIAGHSRSKNGVALLAYVLPGISLIRTRARPIVMAGTSPAMTIKSDKLWLVFSA
jgi:hypothetical protein